MKVNVTVLISELMRTASSEAATSHFVISAAMACFKVFSFSASGENRNIAPLGKGLSGRISGGGGAAATVTGRGSGFTDGGGGGVGAVADDGLGINTPLR